MKGPACITELDGMFAFAIYDSLERALYCARDALGKPLYYADEPGAFCFASEVRALVQAGLAGLDPSLEGVAHLMRQGSIPAPYTHLKDVKFLEPAHWIKVNEAGRIEIHRKYWRIPFVPEEQAVTDRNIALELVREALTQSVKRRARADVPVAAFLSGGVDSAATCAFLVSTGISDLRTFTVTLPGQELDESEHALTTAKHLGTRHTEVPVNIDSRGDWLEEVFEAMDVPSIDGPNTWLVSRAVAKAGIKVACSGVGGDELFFGYPSFGLVPRVARYTKLLAPLAVVQDISSHLPAIPRVSRAIDAAFAGGNLASVWFAKRGLMSVSQQRELFAESAQMAARSADPFRRLRDLGCPAHLAPIRQVSFYELSVYMHDQLLRDTDCMSMAHSLEVRLPLIAKPLVETVAGISARVLEQGGPKGLLRDILNPLVPLELFDRPKRGFMLNWPKILRPRPQIQKDSFPSFLRYRAYEKLRKLPMIMGAAPSFLAIEALAKTCNSLIRHHVG